MAKCKAVKEKVFSDFEDVGTISARVLETIKEKRKKPCLVDGISTGYCDLDYGTGGFHPGELIVIAGRPAMGKTAFALNIVSNLVCHPLAEIQVAFISLDISKEAIVKRLLSMMARVDSVHLRTGNMSQIEWDMLKEESDAVADVNLHICSPEVIHGDDLIKLVGDAIERLGTQIVVIDYIQLIKSVNGCASRESEMEEILIKLKEIAASKDVTIIVLSQLSRSVEMRVDHRPELSDFKEGEAIENVVDTVMFLYRDEYYDKDSKSKGIAEIIVAKQRNRRVGIVELNYDPEFNIFSTRDFN